MTDSTSCIEEQLSALAQMLNAKHGDGGYYRGIARHAPFLLKKTSANPPGYMVKLRKIGHSNTTPPSVSRGPRLEWHDSLPAEYSEAGIRSEAEGDYVFLWIDHPEKLSPDLIANLINSYVIDHAKHFPNTDTYCIDCRQSGSATLIQAASSIATICENCLKGRKQKNASEIQRKNVSDARFSGLLPLSLLLGSFGWAAFWTIYDAIFRITHSDRIWAPIVVIALVMAAVGFGLGWPVGRILHRSGISKTLPRHLLSILAATTIVSVGEIIYASYFVYSATGAFDPSMIVNATLPLASGGNLNYATHKFIFAVGIAAAIYEVSKPKTVKLRV